MKIDLLPELFEHVDCYNEDSTNITIQETGYYLIRGRSGSMLDLFKEGDIISPNEKLDIKYMK